MQKIIFDKLSDMLHSVTIISDFSYTFKDKVYQEPRDIDQKKYDKLNESIPENTPVFSLETLIYRVYHCRIPSINKNTSYKIYTDNRAFLNELSLNNFGTGTWEEGWKIMKIESNGQIAAFKNDLTVWLNRQHFKTKRGHKGVLRVGTYGYVIMPKEFRNLLPGFYTVNGNEPQPEKKGEILLRLYWNIQSTNSWLLVKLISTHLNRIKVPFRFKIVKDPIGYPRADAAVLYIDKEFYKKAKDSIKNIYIEIRNFLNSATPMLAKKMAPGLSLAEDPKSGESFGMHRSRLLAKTLYSIKKKNITSADKMMEELELYFKKSNISIYYPFLNGGSIDDYRVFEST